MRSERLELELRKLSPGWRVFMVVALSIKMTTLFLLIVIPVLDPSRLLHGHATLGIFALTWVTVALLLLEGIRRIRIRARARRLGARARAARRVPRLE